MGGAGIRNAVVSSEAKSFHRKDASLVLAFFWLSGICFGGIIFLSADSHSLLWMRSVSATSVSIVNLLGVTLAPILVSIAAEYLRVLYLLYPVCFFKALQFSFVSCGLLCSFGSAGWLIRLLLLFHDVFSVPMLYFYWLRCLHKGGHDFSAGLAVFLLSAVFLIFSVDICYILPFGACLINNIV